MDCLASTGFEQFQSLIDLVAANEGELVSTPSAPTDLGLCVAADEALGPCIAADEALGPCIAADEALGPRIAADE
jgi:hypothetical protein